MSLQTDRRPVFVREATGLVREFSHLDVFVQSVSICNMALGVVFLLESVGTFFPGANLFMVIVIGLLVALAIAAVWSMLSAAMPRSGGDYVWITRIIPNVPAVGFMYIVTYGLAYAILFNMGFQVWLFINGVMSPTFAGLGLIYNNPALLNLGNWMAAGNGLFFSGFIMVVLAVLTVSLGARRGTRIINYLFYFNILATIVYIGLGFAFSRSAFQGAFDSQFGVGMYANVLKLGQQAGFTGYTFDPMATVLIGFSLGYFSIYANFQYPVWAAGEIKKVNRVWVPFVISMIFAAAFSYVLVWAVFNLMGSDWLGAVSAAYSNASTSALLPFAVAPTFPFFLTVMFRDNPILVFLINAGYVAGVYSWFVVPYVVFARMLFSMSFDRVLPKAFASLTDRGKVPLNALLLVFVLVIVWFSQYAYGLLWNPSYTSFFTVFTLVAGVAPAAMTIAALVFAFFPWLNKSLYESLPIVLRKKIGLPIITWLGGFVAITQALATYEYVVTNSFPIFATATIAVIMVGSFVVYYVIAAIRKREGIDLKYIFNEIPPE